MSNDRGTIKWTSLMLPEHVELLKKMWREDHKQIRPELDSQELELLNETLMLANEQQADVSLSIYKQEKIIVKTGTICKLDYMQACLLLRDAFDDTETISFCDILNAEIN